MGFDLKKFFGKEDSDEYVEIDFNSAKPTENKVIVKPFLLKTYDDMNDILNALRSGYTIAVIDIKPLKTKDIIELKRAISKIKKTIDAMNGSIAGFGDNIIIATPEFAQIHKPNLETKKDTRADFIGDKY